MPFEEIPAGKSAPVTSLPLCRLVWLPIVVKLVMVTAGGFVSVSLVLPIDWSVSLD